VSDPLPKGWASCSLAEIADINMGQSPPGSSYTTDGQGIPFLQGNAEFGDLTPTPAKGTTDPKKTTTEASVLLSVRAPVGATNLSPGQIAIGRGLAAITPCGGIDRRFLLWLLRSQTDSLKSQATGTTFSAITAKVVKAHPVRLPPLGEQARILAAVQERMLEIDLGVKALDRAEGLLDHFRAAILAAAVTGRLGSQRSSPKAEEAVEGALVERRIAWESRQQAAMQARGKTTIGEGWKGHYKEPFEPSPPDGVILPSGWSWATVDQLASNVQYGSSSKTNEDPSGVPVLRMGNIHEGRVRLESLKFLPRDHEEFPELYLEDGDVLFNRTNSAELVGKAAVFRGEPSPCSFASYLIRVQLTTHYEPDLLVYYLSSFLGRAWVGSVVSQQVGQANVNGTKLKQLTIPVPPEGVQVAICRIAELQLRMVAEIQTAIATAKARAERLRRSVLEDAFAGRLVSQDPSDEPASKLLDQIKGQSRGRASHERTP
jgi:type I restriction enzyme S subunit